MPRSSQLGHVLSILAKHKIDNVAAIVLLTLDAGSHTTGQIEEEIQRHCPDAGLSYDTLQRRIRTLRDRDLIASSDARPGEEMSHSLTQAGYALVKLLDKPAPTKASIAGALKAAS